MKDLKEIIQIILCGMTVCAVMSLMGCASDTASTTTTTTTEETSVQQPAH